MNGWTTSRQGLTLQRRALIAVAIGVALVVVTGGSTIAAALTAIAMLVAGFGSLLFTLGLPEGEARKLAMWGLGIGVAGVAARVADWATADPWRYGGPGFLQVAAAFASTVAVGLHLSAWVSAAEARGNDEATSRAKVARGLAVSNTGASVLMLFQGRYPARELTYLTLALSLVALVTLWRALTSLESAIDDRFASEEAYE